MIKQYKIVYILICTLILCSCATKKNIVYFQDEILTKDMEDLTSNFEIRFKTDDLLTIAVSSVEPAAAMPFNLPAIGTNIRVDAAQAPLRIQTYLIDKEGNIEFPEIGTIKIGGLTRSEANQMMKKKLSEYINNPIVNIRLANFSISVLGEVNRPGTFLIQDERISLLEAIGLAGDLTIYGKRENVFLIREIDGQKRYAKFDLTSINVVNSPNFYLTQNDVIYVEPNKTKLRQANYTPNNGVFISAIATLATIAAILIK